jgi:two-component system capsular synthesis response regulator RcsB
MITILKLLSEGLIIDAIPQELKHSRLVPNGFSSKEKRSKKLKIYLKVTNNLHLIGISKELRLF